MGELSSLTPGITEDKEVVSCNPQNYEGAKILKGGVELNLEDESEEEVSQGEGEQRLEHPVN